MNKKLEMFCSYMATGAYDEMRAVEMVYGDKYENPEAKGLQLMAKSKVKKRIKLLVASRGLLATASREFVTVELMKLVEESHATLDPNLRRYALDMLSKLQGYYEKDNQQKRDVSLSMQF